MSTFLKAIIWGAIIGAIVGLVLAVAGYFRGSSGAGGNYDEHGYATIAIIIICAALGVLLGVGAYLKRKFEGG